MEKFNDGTPASETAVYTTPRTKRNILIDAEDLKTLTDAGYRLAVIRVGPDRHDLRVIVRKGRKLIGYLARYLMDPMPGFEVDHVNGDTLDSRRCNLRVASATENRRNRKKANGRSRYKGVYQRTRKPGVWCAQIVVAKGKPWYLGSFQSELEAALAYDNAARRVFGEFAALNFPQPGETPCHR